MPEPTSTELLNRLDDAIDTAEELIEAVTGATAQLGNAVHKTGSETITGEKTFTVSPIVPTPEATDTSQKAANMAALGAVRDVANTAQSTANSAKTLAENALPKTGGALSGILTFSSTVNRNNLPESYIPVQIWRIRDTNNISLGFVRAGYGKTGNTIIELHANSPDNTIDKGLDIVLTPDGTGSYIEGITPPTTASNNAIQTKASVERDFLAKSGGEMTGMIKRKTNFAIADAPTSSVNKAMESILDANDKTLGLFQYSAWTNGMRSMYMTLGKPGTGGSVAFTPYLGLYTDDTGTDYATAPPPRMDKYGADIVTIKSLKDYSPRKLTENITLYVNTQTGSDTEGLFIERGFSTQKPFASPGACLLWAMVNLAGIYDVTIKLCSDVTISGWTGVYAHNLHGITITSDSPDTKRTITYTGAGCINLNSGMLSISQVKFAGSNVDNFLRADGLCYMQILQGVEFIGHASNSVIAATRCSNIFAPYAIGGGATGKRYDVGSNSFLQTYGHLDTNPNIPGSQNGTCDATSRAA